MTPALAISELHRSFGGVRAVDGVSMSVPAGERRAIIGPNGAGKTTLFRCLTGALRATSGRIALFGRDVTEMSEHRRAAQGIGRTYQITNVFAGLTVLDNVLLALNANSRRKWVMHRRLAAYASVRERAIAVLEELGLSPQRDTQVRILSYGARRQLECALALATEPRVLLLDEPAAGLSPAERARIAATIANLPRSMTIILVEHDMALAFGLTDRVTVMHRGRVIADGTPDVISRDGAVRDLYLGNV